jgi:hypothetical protein
VSNISFDNKLNWGSVANVEFELLQGKKNGKNLRIVGKAIRNVKMGCESFQHYKDSVAK